MILIPDKPVFARDKFGQQCSFDLRKLNDDLREAFRQHGVVDQWLMDQFALTMEEKLRNETASATPLSEVEIDTLMTSVLTASGYADVANSFTELRGGNPMRRFISELAPWDDARLKNVIAKRLPLTPRQAQRLIPQCHQAIQQLGINVVSDNFIVELAIHLAHVNELPRPTAVEGLVVEGASETTKTKTVREPSDFLREADDYTRRLLEEQVITPYPVAPLFPRAQLSLSLEKYCTLFTGGWPSELAISARFGQAADVILSLLGGLKQDISDVYPGFSDAPAYVILSDYGHFIDYYFGGASKVERVAFDQGVKRILISRLVKRSAFELLLCYR